MSPLPRPVALLCDCATVRLCGCAKIGGKAAARATPGASGPCLWDAPPWQRPFLLARLMLSLAPTP